MNMKNLGITATATLASALVPFVAAWDAAGKAGQEYRDTVKKLFYFGVALLAIPAGLLCGLVTALAAPLDPRPANSFRGLRSYRFRRNYQGRHQEGVGVEKTSDAMAE